jgi:hypothetical protein
VPVVLTPTLATSGLLLGSLIGSSLWLLRARPQPALLGAALLPPLSLPLWSMVLLARPEERAILAAIGLSLALGGSAWFLTRLLRGWPAFLPAPLLWLAALLQTVGADHPPVVPPGEAERLRLVHDGLIGLTGLALLLLPPGLHWWQIRRAERLGRSAAAVTPTEPATRPPSGSGAG